MSCKADEFTHHTSAILHSIGHSSGVSNLKALWRISVPSNGPKDTIRTQFLHRIRCCSSLLSHCLFAENRCPRFGMNLWGNALARRQKIV